MDEFDKLKKNLKQVGQEHVLNFWEELQIEEKEQLKEQIEVIDFLKLNELYQESEQEKPFSMEAISPIPYVNAQNMKKQEKDYYTVIGEEVIRQGKVAVISMAGGQRYKAWLPWTKSNL